MNECGVNYSNLSYNERKALRKSYPDIVIKKADKGSAVVVWGLDQYCKEAFKQLEDENVYEKVKCIILWIKLLHLLMLSYRN